MTITAIPGPAINYGITLSSSGNPADYNEDRGPSLNDLGEGTMDPRGPFCYKPGNRPGVPIYGWPGCFGGPVVDFVPIAANSSGIALAQSASATGGGQLTVTSSANSSSFRLISAFVPSTYPAGQTVSVLMLDGYQGNFAVGQGSSSPILGAGCGFGTGFTYTSSAGQVLTTSINIWNPLIMAGRCLSITSSSNSDTANGYTISGFDVYGLAMHQTLAGPSSNTPVQTLKAFKYICSSGISFSGGGSGSISVGVTDVYGFPLYVDHPGYITIWWGAASSAVQVTANAGAHTFGYGSSIGTVPTSTTFPSSIAVTSSLGDVRGTWSSTSQWASNGTAASNSSMARLTMNISPKVVGLSLISQSNFWGLVGVPQA
jgi:hypothetical protein